MSYDKQVGPPLLLGGHNNLNSSNAISQRKPNVLTAAIRLILHALTGNPLRIGGGAMPCLAPIGIEAQKSFNSGSSTLRPHVGFLHRSFSEQTTLMIETPCSFAPIFEAPTLGDQVFDNWSDV